MSFIHGSNRFADDRFWRKNRHDKRILRVVGIVTIRAMITLAGPLFQVPVASHTAVAAILIVAVLWAMTLGAELHAV